jgi:hypothetical protein
MAGQTQSLTGPKRLRQKAAGTPPFLRMSYWTFYPKKTDPVPILNSFGGEERTCRLSFLQASAASEEESAYRPHAVTATELIGTRFLSPLAHDRRRLSKFDRTNCKYLYYVHRHYGILLLQAGKGSSSCLVSSRAAGLFCGSSQSLFCCDGSTSTRWQLRPTKRRRVGGLAAPPMRQILRRYRTFRRATPSRVL